MAEKIHRNSLKPGYKLHWYEIKEILGQGGFGITYLAHDTNLDKDVAIKEYLPIELAVRERDASVHPITEDRGTHYRWGLERFITEARTLSKFTHPNIVRVFAVFEENNTAYMVMEYEHGESLQDILTKRKTLEEAELLSILLPIIGGLELVHQAGFIHRDIKPANIFIRKDGSPVLLDFGSARQALGEQTRTLTSLVSPGYAPFEQYYSKSDAQGPWSDIYGLGATMYRAVAGIAPMDAVDRSKAIVEGSRDIFVPAIQIGKGKYSERFLRAIDHALRFKIQERPQNLAEWKSEFGTQHDLAEIDHLQKLRETITQPGTRVVQQTSRRIRPVTAMLTVMLLIGIVIVFYQQPVRELVTTVLQDEPGTEISEPASAENRVLARQQAEQEEARRRREETGKLLVSAQNAMSAGQMIKPPGDNALEYYQEILDIDPGNVEAQQGKQALIDHYLQLAQSEMEAGRFDAAEQALLKGDFVEPGSRDIKFAQIQLREKRARAEQLAREEEQQRLEAEQQRLEEEKKQKEAEEQRLAELEKQKQEEEQKRLEAEQKRLEEEQKQKEEEARLAEQEKQRLEEEAMQKAEAEKQARFTQIMSEANTALAKKDKNLAVQKFTDAVALYPDNAAAQAGLHNANALQHPVCYEVQGTWIWDKALGQDTMILKEDGSIDYQTIIKGSGNWECTSPENRTIKIRLSAGGFSNEWLSNYSKDGSCLTGPPTLGEPGCYHRPAGESRTSGQPDVSTAVTKDTGQPARMDNQVMSGEDICKQIIGVWKWSDLAGTIGRFYADGRVESRNILKSSGNWNCVDPVNRHFTFDTWNKKRDIYINDDFQSLKSEGLLGEKLTATKISSDPTKEIVPEKTRESVPFGR